MKDIIQATAPPLYPILPTEGDGHAYRLQQITRINRELQNEADKRASLRKKYRRAINGVDAADTVLISTGAALGIGGVGLLATIVAIPIAVGLEIGSLGCAGLGVIGKFVSRKLSSKYSKHQQIETMARAKLNTISGIISKALADGNISDIEYGVVLAEAQKFETMKRDARTKAAKRPQSGHELKNGLLDQDQKAALQELLKKLNVS